MHIYKVFITLCIFIILNGCNGNRVGKENLFSLKIISKRTKIKQGDSIQVVLINKKNKTIDSVQYLLNRTPITLTKNNYYVVDAKRYGLQNLSAIVFSDGNKQKTSKKLAVLAPTPPKIYTYDIINEYPHDINAYTQGLEFYNDTLYESTGKKGASSLRKVDYKTGDILKKIDLEPQYFGEGITIIDDKIYMLTWLSGLGFVYDLNSFKRISSFKYNKSKEGWGLTHHNNKIFKSDGSSKIWFLNPDTLTEESYIETVTNTSIFNKANELEFVDDKIYANVYLKDSAMIIDAKTGAIIGIIDFRGLKNKVKQHPKLDVLNGIAYNKKNNTFFVTGKNWDKLFEIRIKEK